MSLQTVFLARLFGLSITIVSIWMLVDEPASRAIIQAFVLDRVAVFMLSLICISAGLAIVPGRQIWSRGIAPVLVTLVGWIFLIRGVVLLSLPHNLLGSLADASIGPVWLYLAGVVALGLGVILTYAGFRAPPIVSERQ
jgi:hypothetical protein